MKQLFYLMVAFCVLIFSIVLLADNADVRKRISDSEKRIDYLEHKLSVYYELDKAIQKDKETW